MIILVISFVFVVVVLFYFIVLREVNKFSLEVRIGKGGPQDTQ